MQGKMTRGVQAQQTAPFVLNLGDQRGFIRGLTHLSHDPDSRPLAHCFTGIPYALPPVGPFRWTPPRSLPPCYRYGTRSQPGGFDGGGCGFCPQPGYRGQPTPALWDEDCLQVNVWLPVGEPPSSGWPVLFYIHGGWLQFGTPNSHKLQAVLDPQGGRLGCIVVQPAYRLNLWGFLAAKELQADSRHGAAGNYGFMDQRLALEWTRNNTSYFGGDAGNITVGGLSAGAHSTFHQLAYDLWQPREKQIIRRVWMVSNGSGVQPKTVEEVQGQFDTLCTNLGISLTLTGKKKLEHLRKVPAAQLMEASTQDMLPGAHEFRAVTDGAFIRRDLFKDIASGEFARRMKDRQVHLLMGEVSDERHVYAAWRPPLQDNFAGLHTRLLADYPIAVVDAALKVWCPDQKLPKGCTDWRLDAYGKIYADLQVYGLARGLATALQQGGAGSFLRRWRIEWRSESCDAMWPKEWGATHGSDVVSVWFQGNGVGSGLSEAEKDITRPWLDALSKFLAGEEDIGWGCQGANQIRVLSEDGQTVIREDEGMQAGLQLWHEVRMSQAAAGAFAAKL